MILEFQLRYNLNLSNLRFVERNIPEQDPFTEPHISTIIESPEKHLSDTFTVAELKPKLSQKPDPFETKWDAKFDCIHSQQEDQLPAPAQTETVETAVETSETQDSVSDGYFSDVMSGKCHDVTEVVY